MPVGGSAVGTLCFVSINPSFLLPSFRCDCVVWSGDRHIYESVRHAGRVLLAKYTPLPGESLRLCLPIRPSNYVI